MRQRDPKERAALAALHDGEPERYLEHKQEELTLTMHASEADAISELSDAWDAAQRQHGRAGVVMIARENHTREQLNRAARAKLRRAGVLACEGVLIGAREYAAGDRVIARRNDRGRDVDNGTLATVLKIDRGTGSMILQTDADGPRELDPGYVAEHVEHAYALTAHGAQGATVTWAGVIGRPEQFSREWAYTALSRAREQTTLHVIAERSERERERDQYAPADAERDSAQTLRALHQAMKRSEVEVLALEQIETQDELANPLSAELAGGDVLPSRSAVSIADADTRQLQAELTEPKRQAAMSTSQRAAPDAVDRQFEAVVARQRVLRTELAERREAHIVRALADPSEHLIAALGPPPENPIARCRWSVRARQIEALHFESAKPPPSTPAPIRGPALRTVMPSPDIRAPTLGH